MAKISIEFDTIEKTMSCTKNGEAISNVIGCNLSRGYGAKSDYRCEIMTAVEDEAEDTYTFVRIVASDTPHGQALVKAGAKQSAVAGFVVEPSDDQAALEAEVLNFFGKGDE